MTIKVHMTPTLSKMGREESGIKRVVEYYYRYGPHYDIEFIDDANRIDEVDVVAVHAGMASRYYNSKPLVSHLHGLYWTADYVADTWAWRSNAAVIGSIRYATLTTVPSQWVAETLHRDMRIQPYVIPHGVEWDEWQHSYVPGNYIVWNKNRPRDVCNPAPVGILARRFPDYQFVTTFAPKSPPDNVLKTGLLPHDKMKTTIQKALVYLSTTKETFGIGILEALAAGTPILGFAYGGNLILVEHGVNGYLARPGDFDDLAQGLEYCIKNRDKLSYYARESAKSWTWDNAVRLLRRTYVRAINKWKDERDRPMKIEASLYRVSENE